MSTSTGITFKTIISVQKHWRQQYFALFENRSFPCEIWLKNSGFQINRSKGQKLSFWQKLTFYASVFLRLQTVANVPAWSQDTGERKWGVDVIYAAVVLLLFLALGFWYSLVTPPFETPDEVYHYAFVRHLAQGYGLPVQSSVVDSPWAQEGSQAPLYYWIVGRLTAGINQDDFAALSIRNPRANIGDPLFPGNKNFMLYSGAFHPLQGANLALHIGRWFSLLLGALTLWFAFLTAHLAFQEEGDFHMPLLVMVLIAAIPQFSFISAACSNDSMIIATSAATLYWLARLVAKPARISIYWGEWGVLGLLLGLAALSKLQGLGLVLLAGVTVLSLTRHRRDWLLPLRAALPVALPALALAGWWYWRNYTLYGDWFGIAHLLSNNGQRPDPLDMAGLWGEFRGLRYSFWGLFGWFNILLPAWVYPVLDWVTLAALGGLLLRLVLWLPTRGQLEAYPGERVRALLLGWGLLVIALLIYWISQATGSQGRLLFPGIGAFAVLLVWGLERWLRWLPLRVRSALRVGRGLRLALPLLLLGCSLYSLVVLLPASYAQPAPITTVPSTAQPVNVVYGDMDKLTLLALEIPIEQNFKPGDRVPVTLYLQADAPIQADYQLFIQFLDEAGAEVGNLTSHPGWGRNPTTLWQPGAIYADHYPVLIAQPIAAWAPLLAHVYMGFVDPTTEKSGRFPIPARNQSGEEIVPFVGQLAIRPLTSPTVTSDMQAVGSQFGHVIQLSAVQAPTEIALGLAQTLEAQVLWEALGTPATEYTAFVHLLDAQGNPITGFDQAPALTRFPTQYWRTGDHILSTFSLPLPANLEPGEYTLWAGLYESASSGALRLPVTAAANQTTGDGQVRIGVVRVRG